MNIDSNNYLLLSKNQHHTIEEPFILDTGGEALDESTMTDEDKRIYLMGIYSGQMGDYLTKETLNEIGKHVRTQVVRKIKFIPFETISGLTKEAIENTRKFPSFWQPDLTVQNTVQNDIFALYPTLANGDLRTKAFAWMGMRQKVIESIRMHQNNTKNTIQKNVVEGN